QGSWYYPVYASGERLFATDAPVNLGSYSDETADELIKDTKFSSDPEALEKYNDYLAEDLPVLWMPNPVNRVSAFSSDITGISPQDPMLYMYPQDWTRGGAAARGAGATTSSCPAPVPPPMTGLDARSSVPPPDPERKRAADVAVRPPQMRSGSRGRHPGHVPHLPAPAQPPGRRRPERVGPRRHPGPDRCLQPTDGVRPAVRHPVPAVPVAPVLG